MREEKLNHKLKEKNLLQKKLEEKRIKKFFENINPQTAKKVEMKTNKIKTEKIQKETKSMKKNKK